jgi:hypothetical protein
MAAGTSPSVAALSGGDFEVAFHANTGNLWTLGPSGNLNRRLGMAQSTSPSVAGS